MNHRSRERSHPRWLIIRPLIRSGRRPGPPARAIDRHAGRHRSASPAVDTRRRVAPRRPWRAR